MSSPDAKSEGDDTVLVHLEQASDASPPVDPAQVHVHLKSAETPKAAPPPAAASSATTAVSAARLAAVRSQVTDACHITPPINDGDGNVFVHVIDGAGSFSCAPSDLTYLVLHASTKPSSYSVVGIMGCQSTGKSTLLNLLFGTQFQEMDSSRGRSQTTKGVWMDSGDRRRDLVIMDLEGTDSGERGEDRTTFERQTSLYALAVAEVLLINMWEHDIGRYTASNYGILKTVFEVNLQLFDAHARTVLLFVIRDHIEEDTPFAQLQTKLEKEVEKIWAEIRKPEKFATATVEDLFELRFVALPHMKLQKQAFAQQVGQLRDQFVQPDAAGYLFASESHGRKAVPADGFGVYMEQCWRAIRANKELNLPTQKEMLATFRCDEIIASLSREMLQPPLAALKDQAAKELISDSFSAQINPLLTGVLREYDAQTQHYHADIVLAKKVEFTSKVVKELAEIYAGQVRQFVAKEMTDRVKREMRTRLAQGAGGKEKQAASSSASSVSSPTSIVSSTSSSSSDAPHPHFTSLASSARSAASDFVGPELAKFSLDLLSDPAAVGLAPEVVRPLVGEWAGLTRKIEAELQQAMDAAIALERAGQLKKLPFHLDKLLKTELSVPLNALLKKASPERMWPDVGALYRKVDEKVNRQYVRRLLESYDATPEELATLQAQSERQLHQLIRLIVDQHAAMIGTYMRSKFDRLFRSDPSGRIRTWTANENIRKLFRHARDEALKQLDLFAVFRLDEYKDADSPANRAAEEAREEQRRPSLSRAGSQKGFAAQAEAEEPAAQQEETSVEDDEEQIGKTTIDYSQVDAANIILDPTARLEKESTFRFEIEGALREAEIAQAQNASNTRVPLWMIGLVCFLGMDEILAVLRNPLLLFLIVVVGGGAYMAHQVGALMPLISVAKATAAQFLAQAQQQFLTQPIATQATAAGASTAGAGKRPSLMARTHERNLSLSKQFSEEEPAQRRAGSVSLSDSSSSAAATVELTEMSPMSGSQPDEEEESPEVSTAAKRRPSRKVE